MVTVESSLIVFLVSLLVGGLAIHLGAVFALNSRDYSHAVVTAALGSLAWWLLDLVLAALSVDVGGLAGPLSLVVWVVVLRWRYDAGWLQAALIGLLAALAAGMVLSALGALGVRGVAPIGVP